MTATGADVEAEKSLSHCGTNRAVTDRADHQVRRGQRSGTRVQCLVTENGGAVEELDPAHGVGGRHRRRAASEIGDPATTALVFTASVVAETVADGTSPTTKA